MNKALQDNREALIRQLLKLGNLVGVAEVTSCYPTFSLPFFLGDTDSIF